MNDFYLMPIQTFFCQINTSNIKLDLINSVQILNVWEVKIFSLVDDNLKSKVVRRIIPITGNLKWYHEGVLSS